MQCLKITLLILQEIINNQRSAGNYSAENFAKSNFSDVTEF